MHRLHSLALSVVVFLATSTGVAASQWDNVGIVVFTRSGCDYFIVLSGRGDYALLEWYGGGVAR